MFYMVKSTIQNWKRAPLLTNEKFSVRFWLRKDELRLTKGQIISKCLFGVFNFLQTTNEKKSPWGFIVVKKNSFVRFLEETSTWKNNFDLFWPLGPSIIGIKTSMTFLSIKLICFCCVLWIIGLLDIIGPNWV